MPHFHNIVLIIYVIFQEDLMLRLEQIQIIFHEDIQIY
jgi:hypothetical protein